jgi:hypothetical protein
MRSLLAAIPAVLLLAPLPCLVSGQGKDDGPPYAITCNPKECSQARDEKRMLWIALKFRIEQLRPVQGEEW